MNTMQKRKYRYKWEQYHDCNICWIQKRVTFLWMSAWIDMYPSDGRHIYQKCIDDPTNFPEKLGPDEIMNVTYYDMLGIKIPNE